MTWTDVLTHAVAFLSGAATGAAGKYLGDKYTDQRHRQEARSEARERFEKIQRAMPGLIAEMKADLAKDDLVREFVALPSSSNHYNSSHPVFHYYEDQHQGLRSKIVLLESAGYVEDHTDGPYKPLYRMTEEFVEHVRQS